MPCQPSSISDGTATTAVIASAAGRGARSRDPTSRSNSTAHPIAAISITR
ncbi:MAG: hypothetical protein JO016_20450 [Actinobacteria bacterium]|nr:hypothetical protein [Actinomycetota bacterium]